MIIALLPAAGWLTGFVYERFGKSVERGNNLLLDEIHDPKSTIPLRMTPLVLGGTIVSHLFGGSAGREGTALQTGASLADQLSRPLRLSPQDRRILLMSGIAAGFGSVFGTPLAGAVFGLEVLAIGRMRYDGLIPCLIAALVADKVTLLWGIHHTAYRIPLVSGNLLWAIPAGIAFGLAARIFTWASHGVTAILRARISYAPLRPVLGGTLVALAVFALHSTRYIGLGIPGIVESFAHPAQPWDFAAKIAFTAVTVGSGFKGGEVTPLFFIGATLGSALSLAIPLPTALLAGMGFTAVFSGAANTPIASTLMAIELFGAESAPFTAVACVLGYLFSGHAGIYSAQKNDHAKH